MIIPYTELAPDTLRALIEEIVTRDGTDYGELELTVSEKVTQVMEQLKRKEIVIAYSELHETCSLIAKGEFSEDFNQNAQ